MARGSRITGGIAAGVAKALLAPLPGRVGGRARAFAAEFVAPVHRHKTPGGPILFSCFSGSAYKAISMALRNEPETMIWIDALIGEGEVLWDIGANLGVWSVYAARSRKARVLAFEPSAQTFGGLYRNIAINGLDQQIEGYCVALSGETGAGQFLMMDANPGTAMHAYGRAEHVFGTFTPKVRQAALSFSIDDFIARTGAPSPDHIKIDVDGPEEAILQGGSEALKRVKSVLIEWVDRPADKGWMERMTALLNAHGLKLSDDPRFATGINRVFVRQG